MKTAEPLSWAEVSALNKADKQTRYQLLDEERDRVFAELERLAKIRRRLEILYRNAIDMTGTPGAEILFTVHKMMLEILNEPDRIASIISKQEGPVTRRIK